MSPPPQADTQATSAHGQLFTVRVWVAAGEGVQPAWRFKVQHVLSGETRFFNEQQALMKFLVSYLSPV
jgi:hypothetical protein